MWRRREWFTAIGLAGLSALAGVAWAQVQQVVRPVPVEVALTPGRAQQADLARARANPLSARARTLLQTAKPDVLAGAEASSVPVLGPAAPALLETARIFVAAHQYTLVVRDPGRLIEIHGTNRAFEAPPGATWPPRPAPPETAAVARARAPWAAAMDRARQAGLTNVMVERTDYGSDVSFERFGAVYSVTLVCDEPTSSACDEAAALDFAAQLQLIAGSPRS